MITTKVTLKIDMDSNKTFSALVTTETDGNEYTQKVGGTNGNALLRKIAMLLNATLEDMADED